MGFIGLIRKILHDPRCLKLGNCGTIGTEDEGLGAKIAFYGWRSNAAPVGPIRKRASKSQR